MSALCENKILKTNLQLNLILVFLMILIGGLTRLTGSGLSIVEWDLIKGILPPLTERDWISLFTAYKASPEFKLINFDYVLSDFKKIFWLEYCHRLLGRCIGFAYCIPLILCFLNRKALFRFLPRFILLFTVVSSQGLLGWLMVKSGLQTHPHVSHYRLAAHLILALILYAATLFTYGQLFMKKVMVPREMFHLRQHAFVILILAFITMTYGALVAGLKAGLLYNTFPLMDNRWIPEGILALHPVLINFVDNPGTVQLIHRLLGLSTLCYLVFLAHKAWALPFRDNKFYTLVMLSLAAGLMQVLLGILTLIYSVPLFLALLHQAGAVVLTTCLSILSVYPLLKTRNFHA